MTDDEVLNNADAMSLLSYLFVGGAPPPAPFPEPGFEDLEEGPLDCEEGTL